MRCVHVFHRRAIGSIEVCIGFEQVFLSMLYISPG